MYPCKRTNDAVNFVSFMLQHHNQHEQGRDVHVLVNTLSPSFSSRRLNEGSAVIPKQTTKMLKLTVQGLVTRANTSKSCNRRTEWKERTNEERRNRISLGCGNCPVAQRQNGSESRTHVLCIQSCWGACRLDQVGAEGEEEEEEGVWSGEGGGGGGESRQGKVGVERGACSGLWCCAIRHACQPAFKRRQMSRESGKPAPPLQLCHPVKFGRARHPSLQPPKPRFPLPEEEGYMW